MEIQLDVTDVEGNPEDAIKECQQFLGQSALLITFHYDPNNQVTVQQVTRTSTCNWMMTPDIFRKCAIEAFRQAFTPRSRVVIKPEIKEDN